jgi:uncharacterized membrane protein
MPASLYLLLLFLHLLGTVVWVGGMVFAHFALRPAAVETLTPPQRLPLMTAVLGRFFRIVAPAVAIIVVTGLAMFARAGFAHAPPGWHVMLVLGTVMALVFVYLFVVLLPRLRGRVQAQAFPEAAKVLDVIRRLVVLNLTLGIVVIAAAIAARA